jgi:hypothetical protein
MTPTGAACVTIDRERLLFWSISRTESILLEDSPSVMLASPAYPALLIQS